MPLSSVRSFGDLEIGATVDRYEVIRHVAYGGMGSVWLARFTGKHGFEKLVAIKTIRPELAQEPRFRAMFLDEARLTARLSHTNIAQVLDVGEHGPAMYIVFEWVDGTSLEEQCLDAAEKGEPLSVELLLRRTMEICAGLHAAHELRSAEGTPLGIVHRDVSPMNVLVSKDGFAKIIDFGVALARDRLAPETRSGVVKGTPQYMAPEQAMGREVDRRADIWSVGATLYRALAGAPPFADREELAAFIAGGELRPLPETIPREVRAVVERALRMNPVERFATAEDMRLALEEAVFETRTKGAKAALAPPPLQATTLIEGASKPKATLPETQLETPRADPAMRAARERADREERDRLARAKSAVSMRALTWAMIAAAIAAVAAMVFAYRG